MIIDELNQYNKGDFLKKSNETQLTRLVKKYCEVETLPEANIDIGK